LAGIATPEESSNDKPVTRPVHLDQLG
jgi:hypothetical protein